MTKSQQGCPWGISKQNCYDVLRHIQRKIYLSLIFTYIM